MSVCIDTTEQKKPENQTGVQNLMASLGQLASGVAHELNNPLMSVIGFSDLLLRKDLADDVLGDLKIVNGEAMRAALVVERLLAFASLQPREKQPLDMNEMVKTVLKLRNHEQSEKNIRVVTRLTPGMPKIMGNEAQLQQVFLNIVVNAEQAMFETHQKGTLTISTKRSGDFIRASFCDDGPGIQESQMPHLFTPFFTTKGIGKGTGLGLSTAYGIVLEHGGDVHAESQPGYGATFIVDIPVFKTS